MNNCNVCLGNFSDEDSIICASCKQKCHYICHYLTEKNFKKLSKDNRNKWKCSACKQVSVSPGQEESEMESDVLMRKMTVLFEQFSKSLKKDIDQQLGELTHSVKFVSDSFDSFKSDIGEIKKANEQLITENQKLKEEVKFLSKRNEILEEYTRRENLLLTGIPATKNENMDEILQGVASALQVSDFSSNEISVAHRLPSMNRETTPMIVVRFVRRSMRDKWMTAFQTISREDRSSPGIDVKKINRNLPNGHFRLMNQLTAKSAKELKAARELARENDWKFVWFRGSQMCAKKSEGSPVFKVKGLDHLKKVINGEE